MVASSVLLLLLTVPCFMLMVQLHTLLALIGCTAATALGVGALAAAATCSVAESMPVSLRAGALGIVYALAISGFGGTAQFVVTWLIDVTGSPLAPAWYMTVAVMLGLMGIIAMPESAPRTVKYSRASA
jgi:MHS family citrate/tricarballylate:H+ symporter-like MFS transporter